MKKSVLILGMLLSSASAFALRGGDFGVGNGGDGLEMAFAGNATTLAAPAPISNEGMNYKKLKELWEQGVPLNEQILTGQWKLVVEAKISPACGDSDRAEQNINGIKNDDGSVTTLDFKTTYGGGNDFTGSPGRPMFSVSILNIIFKNLNQGPYKVDSREPQFAFWYYLAYGTGINGRVRSEAYAELSCRGLRGNPNRILCSLSGKNVKSAVDKNADPSWVDCVSSPAYGIAGFAKVTSK